MVVEGVGKEDGRYLSKEDIDLITSGLEGLTYSMVIQLVIL